MILEKDKQSAPTGTYKVDSRVSAGKIRVVDYFNRGMVVETDKPYKKGDYVVIVSGVPVRKVPAPKPKIVSV